MSKFTPERREALHEVVRALHATFGEVTPGGVAIDKIHGFSANGVRYFDPAKENAPIREMSGAAYAAEFFKLAGGSLDTAEFDTIIPELIYVGSLLGSISLQPNNLEDYLFLHSNPGPVAGLPPQDYSGDFC